MKSIEDVNICVYAICKNESKFVDRWVESLKEADKIIVLDTGSTDDTVEKLQKYSPLVTVYEETIDPWRFDTARNESLKYIPSEADICVVSDLDQVFRPGWSDVLKKNFIKGYDEIYGLIIDYDDDNKEIKHFLSKNVHPNNRDWYWERPIHEGIHYHGKKDIKTIVDKDFVIEHHPDRTKSRDSYLQLLENEYKDNHKDPMCAIYYGCELCFHDRNEEGLKGFLKALDECDFTDNKEIHYQMLLNISDLYLKKPSSEDKINAYKYAEKAYETGIRTRKVFVALADASYALAEISKLDSLYFQAIDFLKDAIFEVPESVDSWIESNDLFGAYCYDAIALIYYKMEKYFYSVIYGALAIEHDTENNPQLIKNMKYYIQKKENKNE